MEFFSKEVSLNIHKIASNETALITEVPEIIDKGSVTIAPGQGKTSVRCGS